MKRINILIVFALSTYWTNAQEQRKSEALRINRSEYFKSEAKEAEAIALSYLQARRELYGLSDSFRLNYDFHKIKKMNRIIKNLDNPKNLMKILVQTKKKRKINFLKIRYC